MDKVFVLVQTRNYPEYVIDCIKQIRFFNQNLIFLLSDSYFYYDYIKDIKNVEIININKLVKGKNHISFINNQLFDDSFRNGFWVCATERFFIIEDFMKLYNIRNIIQIETDNLIYNNYDKIFDILEKTSDFSIILDNKYRCIPSIVFIKERSTLETFNNFYINYCLTKKLNDMESLALFYNIYNKKYPISNLPITLPNHKFYLLKHIHGINYYNNINLFNGIFDAAAFGQYLGGVDPRNINGNTVGFINETSVVKPNKFNITWEEDNFKRKRPFIQYRNRNIPIFNLHIHSKNLKMFMSI